MERSERFNANGQAADNQWNLPGTPKSWDISRQFGVHEH
jgi:hypothetical protein